MTKQEISGYIKRIYNSLEKKQIKDVFDTLNLLIMQLQNWQLREKLFELEENYKRMLDYLMDGFQDPERDRIYQDLIRNLYEIADSVKLELKTAYNASFFYAKRRTYLYSYQTPPFELVASLNDISSKIDLLSLLEDNQSSELIGFEQEKETLFQQIFSAIWLSGHWNKETRNSWKEVLNNPLTPVELCCLIVSATSLNLQTSFDEEKALFLLEEANNNNEEIKQRALTGILLFLREYDNRLCLYPSITSRLEHLKEDVSFVKNIRNIILQFILSRETEKISRKIKEELLPKMMKMGPKLQNRFKIDDVLKDIGTEDKNPEWEKIIKQEGLEDQFQEISELQMEGADILHSSFSHLKNYSFFNETANWFMPFRIPANLMNEKQLRDFAKLLQSSTMISNSDKYSFFLSIAQMPESYRKMMMGQFSMESDSAQELLKEEAINESKKISSIIRQYVQDLYRFYKLHPHKNDFQDIFEATPEFYKVPSIFALINDAGSLYIIGEYYFKKNYFEEATDIFNRLSTEETDNGVLYQKLGYCSQMTGNLEEAVDYYSKAELLSANNPWIIKKMAYCYRLLKQPEDALLYYKKAEKLNPDNLSIQLSIGHCLLELKDYDEAIKYYFKVEYLETEKNKPKAWRPIAWCSFLMGKYNQALDYYSKIIENNPNATDYLNTGHTQLVIGNMKDALRMYVLSVKDPNSSLDKFIESFHADMPDLSNAGIKESDIPFILDRLKYEL